MSVCHFMAASLSLSLFHGPSVAENYWKLCKTWNHKQPGPQTCIVILVKYCTVTLTLKHGCPIQNWSSSNYITGIYQYQKVIFTCWGPGEYQFLGQPNQKSSTVYNSWYLPKVFTQTGLSKLCSPRSNTTECSIWSECALFAYSFSDTSTSIKMDLFKG